MRWRRRLKYDEAIVEFTKAIALDPKDERLYVDRGRVYRAATKIPEAMADFTKAIELAPKNELGYFERGRTQLSQNQYEAALADLNKAIELNPNNPVALRPSRPRLPQPEEIGRSHGRLYRRDRRRIRTTSWP